MLLVPGVRECPEALLNVAGRETPERGGWERVRGGLDFWRLSQARKEMAGGARAAAEIGWVGWSGGAWEGCVLDGVSERAIMGFWRG